jgi:hypothetical protein
MSIELKIKSKHLALEPAIIRKEEHKLLKQISWYKEKHQVTDLFKHKESLALHRKWWNLQDHRRKVVRNEARATYLARAYLAGTPYEKVEKKTREDDTLYSNILPRVYSMVAKYGPKHIGKKWNKDQSKYVYDENDWKELTDAIKKWCNIE